MNNYKLSGVDVEAGYQAVDLIAHHVKSTHRNGCISGIGGFAGLFSLARYKDMEEPILASGTDGVGTKLKIAFAMDKHDTVGIDCVAYSVNDIICTGAEPLYFLDYIAVGKVNPQKVGEIVKGIAEGCVQANCALVGGETAEMPGFYPDDEYDLAGTAVGIIDKKNIIDGSKILDSDVIIGIASSGLHSNGFSLVRKLLNPSRENVGKYVAEFGRSLGEELLEPTKIYVKTILGLIKDVEIKGICNITGGGFLENIPRMLPSGNANSLQVRLRVGSWSIPPVFSYLQGIGSVSSVEMHNIFNMGIGMAVAVAEADVDRTLQKLNTLGENAFVIGDIVRSADGGMIYA